MVNVKKKKNIQTSECRPSSLLSDLQLNKSEGSSSVASYKTLFNSSKECRKSERTPAAKISHNGTDLPKHSACAQAQDFVFVLSQNGKPLMPTKSGKARRLLKSGEQYCILDLISFKKAVKRLSARKTVLIIRKNSEAQFLLPLKEQVSLREDG